MSSRSRESTPFFYLKPEFTQKNLRYLKMELEKYVAEDEVKVVTARQLLSYAGR